MKHLAEIEAVTDRAGYSQEVYSNCCLIIGNGPSLKDIPVEFLQSYPSFGSNRIYLLDGFTPTYYAATNPLIVEQFSDEINVLDCMKFVGESQRHLVPGAFPLHMTSRLSFSHHRDEPIYEGYTVTYVLLQLAYWMGYQQVGLIGVDHRYKYTGSPNQVKEMTQENDVNHFAPGYFAGYKRHNPDLAKSENSYNLARREYMAAGRRIVNLTPGSALTVFDREDWQSWQR